MDFLKKLTNPAKVENIIVDLRTMIEVGADQPKRNVNEA
jgi:hypothetical protein